MNGGSVIGHAQRASQLLSTLDRGATRDRIKRRHPARELIIPARQIAKQMKDKHDAATRPPPKDRKEGANKKDKKKTKGKKGGGGKKGKKKK